MTDGVCPDCGRPLQEHDRDIRFRWPDTLLESGMAPDDKRVHVIGPNIEQAAFLVVDDLGWFFRALVAIRLAHGYSVNFGVWVSVPSERELRHVHAVWDAPGYADLVVEARLANRIPPWDELGRSAHVVVADPEALPWVTRSSDPGLSEILSREWDHELVLGALPES